MRSLLPIVLCVLVGCTPASNSPEPVAVVNGRTISVDQYQRSYRDYLFSGGLEDEPTRRSAFLNRMIAVELISAEARDNGIEDTEAFVEAREQARQKMLIEAWLADVVYADIEATEADLVDQFVRVNTQTTARHLFAPTQQAAQTLKARLDGGESFESIAREIFADPVLAENGGLLGTFGFDEMDPDFENAAFEQRVGEVGDPVRTSQGWSVIKVEDRFTKPIMTETEFAEKRPQLEGYVLERKQNLARRAYLDAVVSDADVVLNEEVAAGILGASLEQTGDGEGRALVTFRNGDTTIEWTPNQLREAARFTSERQRRSVDNLLDLQAFVEGLVTRSIILERAADAGLGRDDRVRQGLDAAMSEWIYEHAFDDLVEGMNLSEADLRAYFETYQDEFQQPRRARVSEIVTASREEGDALRARLNGSNFAELARQHSLRPESAADGGRLGLFSADELGPWADDVFAARPGAILGPLPAAGKYIMLQVEGFEAPRPATFEEARDQVEAMLRRERQQDFLRSHVQELRARYPVRIVIESLDSLPLTGSAHA